MRFKRHIELAKGQLDIAPLIDVVFLLLIFFMLTSNFISQTGIRVNLPDAVASEPIRQRDLVIFITDRDGLIVNDEKISLKKLTSKIKTAAKTKADILIKADKKASLGRVVEIWDLCREAGVTNVNIATAPKD